MAKKQRKQKQASSSKRPSERSGRSFPFGKLGAALLVGLIGFLVYFPARNYDFVYDDDAVIKENKFVQKGLSGLGDIWTTSYFRGYDPGINARAFRPVPLSSFALEVELFGLNPKVHHLGNLFYYFLTGIFLTIFLLRLFRDYHFALPLAIALLFMLHPVHVEVVANIKSRDTLLGFLGAITAGWAYLNYWDGIAPKKYGWLGLSLFAYAFGLFAKEEVLTFFGVLVLMPYFFRQQTFLRSVVSALPFLGLALFFVICRSAVIGGLNAGVEIREIDNSLLAAASISERIASTIFVLGYYLWKTIFPHPLISDYSLSTLPLVGWTDYRVYLSLLSYGGLLGLVVMGWRRRSPFAFGALFFLGAVSIFSSILFANVNAYADRFNYTPSLGIVILVVFGLWQLGGKLSVQKIQASSLMAFAKAKPVALVGVLVLSGLGIGKITTHLPVWQNRFALFDHDVKAAPNNARMLKNYGGSLVRLAMELQTSDPEQCKAYAQQAVDVLTRQEAIYARIPTGFIHKGIALTFLGRLDEAITSLTEALRMDGDNYSALVNISNAYYRKGEYQKALEHMQGIDADRMSSSDLYLVSLIYERLGNQEAANAFRQRSGR